MIFPMALITGPTKGYIEAKKKEFAERWPQACQIKSSASIEGGSKRAQDADNKPQRRNYASSPNAQAARIAHTVS